MKEKPTKTPSDSVSVSAKLLHIVPDDVITMHIDQIAVSAEPDKFIISMFQHRKPVLLGTREEKAEKARAIKEIKALCVGQFVVTPQVAIDLARAVSGTTKLYHKEECEEVEK